RCISSAVIQCTHNIPWLPLILNIIDDEDRNAWVASKMFALDFQRRLTKIERQQRMSVLQSERSSRHHEQQRLNKAQMMQRELQELEEKQRILEEEGVKIEKRLRGANGVDNDNPVLMQEWFKLIGERNLLLRKESELVIMMQELELEDRQGRLQQRLDDLSALNASEYDEEEQQELDRLLQEKLEVVEQRNTLVSLLEEQRLLEKEED
uniref:BMERB domain-containing protein n=1 Tax=Petromyzon marinus TaxID=7757 RepID=S4RVF1_PETMA